MYKAIANTIRENLNPGYAVFPTEGDYTHVKKMPVKSFLGMDYRVSNPQLLCSDKESIVTGNASMFEERSAYFMGFLVVKSVSALQELSASPRSTVTRIRNRLIETVAQTLSRSEVRKLRGARSVFIEKDTTQMYQRPTDDMIKALGWDSSTVDVTQWVVIPFLTSTSIFFNNFRVTLGVGNVDTEKEYTFHDMESRLKQNLNELIDKLNKRLSTPIADSLYGGLFLASPLSVMEEKNSIVDYSSCPATDYWTKEEKQQKELELMKAHTHTQENSVSDSNDKAADV